MIDHPAQKISYAFPFTISEGNGHGEIQIFGMTLHDYFAAAALQGMMSNSSLSLQGPFEIYTTTARSAYQYADAMLAERAK